MRPRVGRTETVLLMLQGDASGKPAGACGASRASAGRGGAAVAPVVAAAGWQGGQGGGGASGAHIEQDVGVLRHHLHTHRGAVLMVREAQLCGRMEESNAGWLCRPRTKTNGCGLQQQPGK